MQLTINHFILTYADFLFSWLLGQYFPTKINCFGHIRVQAQIYGVDDMIFVIEHFAPMISMPSLRVLIAMVVSMHVPSATASKSVGEKASPLPWLSVGASVSILVPD
jgi:hypothetical protein